MPTNVLTVFSHPAPEVDEAEYNAYYDFHTGRILTYPGFVGNRRYLLTPVLGRTSPAAYEYLSLYEIDVDPADAHGPLRADVVSGVIQHPDWFKRLSRSSWHGDELDASATGWLFDELVLVLSSAPAGVSDDEYVSNCGARLADHLRIPGVLGGGRFRLQAETVNPDAPSAMTMLALYGVDGSVSASTLVPPEEAAEDERVVAIRATALGPARRPAAG